MQETHPEVCMCCFSGPVAHVSSTQIFARRAGKHTQYLVYSMTLEAKQDLAMILPIPVPKASRDDAVKFIDLSRYPEFFADLARGFPEPPSATVGSRGTKGVVEGGAPKLAVVDVGSFEASFVPSIEDFKRLDAKFRMPTKVWKALPQYAAYGFAVFKLKSKHHAFHPMAFEFPTTLPKQLFFPTVHVHDGEVHDQAHFDHALYCQSETIHPALVHWEESTVPVGMLMDYTRGAPVVERYTHVLRKKIEGLQPNRDTLVG
jgi:hypothetical protein